MFEVADETDCTCFLAPLMILPNIQMPSMCNVQSCNHMSECPHQRSLLPVVRAYVARMIPRHGRLVDIVKKKHFFANIKNKCKDAGFD